MDDRAKSLRGKRPSTGRCRLAGIRTRTGNTAMFQETPGRTSRVRSVPEGHASERSHARAPDPVFRLVSVRWLCSPGYGSASLRPPRGGVTPHAPRRSRKHAKGQQRGDRGPCFLTSQRHDAPLVGSVASPCPCVSTLASVRVVFACALAHSAGCGRPRRRARGVRNGRRAVAQDQTAAQAESGAHSGVDESEAQCFLIRSGACHDSGPSASIRANAAPMLPRALPRPDALAAELTALNAKSPAMQGLSMRRRGLEPPPS